MSRNERNWTEQEFAEWQRKRTNGGVSLPALSQTDGKPDLIVRSPRAKGPTMNRWEQEYALELAARKQAGEIEWWGFEAIKLKLTGNTFYTPDFVVRENRNHGFENHYTHLQAIEIKGFLRDDANVKFKMAAELFPFEFLMYRKRKAKEGGGWELLKHLNGGGR